MGQAGITIGAHASTCNRFTGVHCCCCVVVKFGGFLSQETRKGNSTRRTSIDFALIINQSLFDCLVIFCVSKLILSILSQSSIGNMKMIISKRRAIFMFQVKRCEGMSQAAMPLLIGDWMVRDEIVSMLKVSLKHFSKALLDVSKL